VGYDVRPTGDKESARKELGRYENIRVAAEYEKYIKLFEPSFFSGSEGPCKAGVET
jgi:hypothetical protein